ncbi:hypothetical protein GBAR_LOCUS17865 [Geodia barretti]|uniref:SAM domain-containing protein n=1 Tax=Geodia barretti TaxID=519541 RepID=A0AA35SKX2_GEOBA|nr:hypothetical protein GBAR_LOCUS17865 [Geodia barretti]
MARRFDGLSTDHSTSASQGGNSLSLSESILDNIFEHKIDGEVFLSLNDENLREIAPLLGDRLKIKRLISETLVKLDTCLQPVRSALSALPSASALGFVGSAFSQEDDDSLPERCNKDVCEINHGEPSSPGLPKLDWAEGLALPTRFSTPTTKAIETGVLTKSARVEIVHSVATLMLMHTSRPTPHDLDTVSRRLIVKHPKLRDTVDKGYMLNEFCSLTGAEECKFKENWGKYEKLVFKYAPLEQKKSLKIFCISIMLRSVTMLVDRTAAYTLDLLWALLSTNRSSGQPLISIFEVCVIISCAHNNIPIHTGRWRGRVSQQHTNLPAVVQRAAYVLCIIM